jgi:SAM-dependent methyltransferase
VQFPEVNAGGFSRVDGKVAFYGRVQELVHLAEDAQTGPVTIVDFGAGRGAGAESPVPIHRRMQHLRGPGRTFIGLDIDPAVQENPFVDEARVIPDSGVLPLDDASVDVIVSEFVIEHVDDPDAVTAELHRVLKPGGWFCAYTPNKWGYIAVAARLIPNRHHVSALHKLQPSKHARDTFPTRYRMNTRRALERLFAGPRWELYAYTHDAEPHLYAGGSKAITGIIRLARLLPPGLRSSWMIYARKAS